MFIFLATSAALYAMSANPLAAQLVKSVFSCRGQIPKHRTGVSQGNSSQAPRIRVGPGTALSTKCKQNSVHSENTGPIKPNRKHDMLSKHPEAAAAGIPPLLHGLVYLPLVL